MSAEKRVLAKVFFVPGYFPDEGEPSVCPAEEIISGAGHGFIGKQKGRILPAGRRRPHRGELAF